MATATSTMDTLFTAILNPFIDILTHVFTSYWPYIIAFIVLSGIVGLFISFTHRVTGGRK